MVQLVSLNEAKLAVDGIYLDGLHAYRAGVIYIVLSANLWLEHATQLPLVSPCISYFLSLLSVCLSLTVCLSICLSE